MRTSFFEIGGVINTDLRPAAVGPYCTPNFSEFGTHLPMRPRQTHRIPPVRTSIQWNFHWIEVRTEGMRWVWRGRIDKCVPNSEKLGVQYGPTAAGRRSVLHPQFRRMRFALSMCPSQTHRIYIVICKLKPATSSENSFSICMNELKCLISIHLFQVTYIWIYSFFQ